MKLRPRFRRAALALLLLAGASRLLRATDDGGELYQGESAITEDAYDSGPAEEFPGEAPPPDPTDENEAGAASNAPADSTPVPPAPDPAPAAPDPTPDPAPADPDPTPAPDTAATPDPAPAPDPPPSDPAPADPPPAAPPAPPAPLAPPAPPVPPPFDRARMRFNSLGAGGGSHGSSFIATDPAGLSASPWPSFQNPPPAAASR